MAIEKLLGFALLCLLAVEAYNFTYCPYDNYYLFTVTGNTQDQVALFKKHRENYKRLYLRTLLELRPGVPGLYLATSEVALFMVETANQLGLRANVTATNFQRFMDDGFNITMMTKRQAFYEDRNPQYFSYYEFHPIEDIVAYFTALCRKYPHLITQEVIGKSWHQRDLYVYKIGTNRTSNRGIFIDATIHAREWLATSTAIFIATQLIMKYDTDRDIRDLVDKINWYIMPVINADGYAHTWRADRFWRQSRSVLNGANTPLRNCFGADLNRNWDVAWNTTDACPHPCCSTYPGTGPMSEPEVMHLGNKLISLQHRVQAYLSLHSYSQLLMYPYGYKTGVLPPDVDELDSVANSMADAIKNVHGTVYKVGPAANILYEMSGSSLDWVKQKTKIKYVYLLELRPMAEANGYQGHFCVGKDQIVPTGEEVFAGVRVLADAVLGKLKLNPNRGKIFATTEAQFGGASRPGLWWTFFVLVTLVAQLLRPRMIDEL